ncbi:hypothetical protein D3C72_881800 [compost metagenome]
MALTPVSLMVQPLREISRSSEMSRLTVMGGKLGLTCIFEEPDQRAFTPLLPAVSLRMSTLRLLGFLNETFMVWEPELDAPLSTMSRVALKPAARWLVAATAANSCLTCASAAPGAPGATGPAWLTTC